MNSISMYPAGVSIAANWQTLRGAEAAFTRSAHHAIPLPKRRTAATSVASVNRGTI